MSVNSELLPNTTEASPYERVAYRYLERGYSVIPIAPGTKRPGQYSEVDGWRGMSDWQRFNQRLPTELETEVWYTWPGAGIGLLTGKLSGVIGLDRDHDAPGTQELDRLIPYTPVKKKGAKGYTAFFRYNGEKSCSFDVGGARVLDVLSEGRQTLMPGTIHPDGHTYIYLTEDLLEDYDPADLPALPDDFLEQVARTLEPYQTQEDKNHQKKHITSADADGRINSASSISAQYFHDLNQCALAHLDEWVPKIIPVAEPHNDGYRCVAIWRNCKNPNVSIHPQGIMDWGGGYGMTPIDLVKNARVVTFQKAVEELRALVPLQQPTPISMTVGGVTTPKNVPENQTQGAAIDWDAKVAEYLADKAKRGAEAAPEVWSEPVDPFVEHAAPQFPVDHLPEAFATYCHELSTQSGFDAGGYGFALLVAASNLIDHRARLNIGPLNVPAFLWGGLVASAGAGKSPIMSAAMKFAHRVNEDLVHDSLQEREDFLRTNKGMKQKEFEALDQPPWKQLVASDTTIEALGFLLKDNPTGLLLAYDELSEFVGRMDAYNGGTGKDRGTYLQAFDGGSKTINRKSSIVPLVVENFSVGVLAGVQPEKLAEMFKKSGGADGLFQRFIVYALPRPGNVDYAASLGTFTETNCGQVFQRLHEWSRSGVISRLTVDPAVLPLMENYHRHIRIIAQRTASSRLAEHYDKFPGFLGRILFALHCMECAAQGRFSGVVTVETFNRAHAIAHVLYRHSEAVYEALGQHGAGSSKLMKVACEAILAKRWIEFGRADLTRNATGWRDADDREAQGAIDLLIEFDWVREIMPEKVPGRPGRRSVGVFKVNQLVHQRFAEQSQRIANERAARYAAIQEVAAIRRERPWE